MNERKGTAGWFAAGLAYGFLFRYTHADKAVAEAVRSYYERLVTATARIWNRAVQAEHGFVKESKDAR